MSILYPGSLPKILVIDGKEYRIRWKYFIVLEIMRVFNSDKFNEVTVLDTALDLFYRDRPEDPASAITAMFEFIEKGSWDNGALKEDKGKVLDWDIDAPFIWASMKQAYPGWDWSQAHWWEFKAAFDSLPGTCKIMEVVRIRSMKIDSKMSADQQKAWADLKKVYALPQGKVRTAKEIEAELMARAGVKNV